MNKQQIKLIAAIAALVILIAVAYVLYSKLGDKYRPGSLVTKSHDSETEPKETASSSDIPGEETDDYSETSAISDTGDSGSENSLSLAPDFTVEDGEGNPVKLSDFRGTPVVLNFWASWCPPCKSEMPDFEAAYKKYGDKIKFMMVNVTDGSSETVETAKAFIESTSYTFPIYFDTALEAAISYSASSIPMTFFINADGSMEAYGRGMLDAASLEQGIAMITE